MPRRSHITRYLAGQTGSAAALKEPAAKTRTDITDHDKASEDAQTLPSLPDIAHRKPNATQNQQKDHVLDHGVCLLKTG